MAQQLRQDTGEQIQNIHTIGINVAALLVEPEQRILAVGKHLYSVQLPVDTAAGFVRPQDIALDEPLFYDFQRQLHFFSKAFQEIHHRAFRQTQSATADAIQDIHRLVAVTFPYPYPLRSAMSVFTLLPYCTGLTNPSENSP